MDKLIPKALWLFTGACLFFITFSTAQDVRPLPVSSRRRLPTVIITREHLRQRQNSYGAHGDTAAEFVVSAGLDTSKNTAVRIRRIGNRRLNATHNTRFNLNRFNFRNDNVSRGTVIRPRPQYRTPSFQNAYERNGISDIAINRRYHLNEGDENRQVIDRRHHLGENEQRIRSPNGGFYRTPNRNHPIPERQIYQYRPPIFVHNFQQNRRADVNVGVPGEANLRPSNNIDTEKRRFSVNSHEQAYPIVSVKYSTSSVSSSVSQKQQPQRPIARPSNVDSSNRKPLLSSRNNNKQNDRLAVRGNNPRLPFLSQNNTRNYQKEKPATPLNNTDSHISTNNPLVFASKQHSEKSDISLKNGNSKSTTSSQNTTFTDNNDKSDIPSKKENAYNKIKDEELKDKVTNTTREVVSRNPVVESANPDQNVLAETPTLQSNSDKIREFQTRLIRKPSLILRDQITVNELPRKSDRTRYGPRSLENIDEIPLSRRKRQVEINEHQEDVYFDNKRENMTSSNGTATNKLITNTSHRAQRRGKYDRRIFQIENPPNESFKIKHLQQSINGSSGTPKATLVDNESRISVQYQPGEQFSDGTYYHDNDKGPNGDIMAFSDFISSPLAEKMRLERQLFFRNKNGTEGNSSIDNPQFSDGKFDSRSMKNSTMTYLRNLITARLLHILNLSNFSSNYSKLLKSGRSSEEVNSAEQRHIGIMVSPYESQESYDSRSSSPVVRILKGKIVSLPDIPPELIPIILGTYKPTYTEPEEPKEPAFNDDPKLTENIIDNAILKLLQNDELLNLQPGVIRKVRPIAYKVNRKSPSTNYVGSLKTNEPMGRPNYGFKPHEWSLEPRCDRLTEEICLDDSDYPSSAIMSSIYKDKNKFDLMYAEVKVHESQVEGLSRQQEIAYSFDHYYGAYPQASGSNLIARDYGANGGFVCPSEVHYARPHRAKNRKGEWKVVVNVGEYTQTLRMEKCLSSGNPCKYVVNHMQSTCSQVYSYHRLLVFSKENGLHIDVFRVPTSCTCHLRPGQKPYNPKHAASSPYLVRPGPFDEYAGHVETASTPQHLAEKSSLNHEKKKNSFSNTLWAILGGGPQAGALAQQPQFLDEVQKQIMWTQQLKQYPQLMKQISPNQVLKQLLEEDEEDYSIRRQRFRQKHPLEKLTSGSFSGHQVPMVVPLPPPPPPPPNTMLRRPMVNISPMDHKHLFGVPNEQSKIFAISSPSEQTKVFSLTKDSKFGKSPVRANYDAGYGNMYTIVGPQTFSKFNAYKVHPGMYPPKSENIQIPESSLLPVAPQFSSHPDNRLRPVMRPMPAPHGSNKNIVEDEDLIAAEKSVGEDVQSFAVETETDSRVVPHDDDSKINFSYHPILEYLNV